MTNSRQKDDWTEAGRKYLAQLDESFRKALRDIHWDEECRHDKQQWLRGDRWECRFCQRPIECDADARAAKMKHATDPLQRWCPRHDEPYYDMGGGPGSFSQCRTCMAEAYSK